MTKTVDSVEANSVVTEFGSNEQSECRMLTADELVAIAGGNNAVDRPSSILGSL